MLGLVKHAWACPLFYKITKRQYLWERLSLTGIVRHRFSANQIVICFKLKKLENYMRYQVGFLLPLKLQKYRFCRMANQFVEFFIFDMFDFLILALGGHCYMVLVFSVISINLLHFSITVMKMSLLVFKFGFYYWTLGVSRTTPYEISRPSVRLFVRLSVRWSVTKFSQDRIISFFWYCTWW